MTPAETIKALGELHATDSPTRLIDWVLNDLRRRFGSDFGVWTQLSGTGEIRGAMLADGIDKSAFRYGPAIQHNLVRDHPVFRICLRENRNRIAGKLTDFVSQREFDRSALCQEAYRHLGMRRQLALIFKAPDGGVCTFAFGRSGSDFSPAQSLAVSNLTLHLQLALNRLWHIEALECDAESALAARFRASRVAGSWYYAFADEPTSNLVLQHFGGAKAFMVPARLARHFSAAAGGTPQSATAVDGSQWILSLSSQSDTEAVITLRRGQPATEAVAGLTLREAEILQWIAKGKRDAEISIILGIATRTVSKHVEHILAKLGVETRGAAVAAARKEF